MNEILKYNTIFSDCAFQLAVRGKFSRFYSTVRSAKIYSYLCSQNVRDLS